MSIPDELSQPELDLGIIAHELEATPIPQRTSDGYVNATAMCKAANKRWNDYSVTGPAKAFADALSRKTGMPVMSLILTVQGTRNPGTWVHPQVAIHLAQWCSADFAVAVTQWVMDWMSGRIPAPSLPYHVRRYLANKERIPHTHFSMLNELMLHVIAPLEAKGYALPDSLIPDGSTGRMFSEWLRQNGHNPDSFPSYAHHYEDGRVVYPRLYPNALLASWRAYLHETWMPKRMVDYFAERDRRALNCIATAYPALTTQAKEAIAKLEAKEVKLLAAPARPKSPAAKAVKRLPR